MEQGGDNGEISFHHGDRTNRKCQCSPHELKLPWTVEHQILSEKVFATGETVPIEEERRIRGCTAASSTKNITRQVADVYKPLRAIEQKCTKLGTGSSMTVKDHISNTRPQERADQYTKIMVCMYWSFWVAPSSHDAGKAKGLMVVQSQKTGQLIDDDGRQDDWNDCARITSDATITPNVRVKCSWKHSTQAVR